MNDEIKYRRTQDKKGDCTKNVSEKNGSIKEEKLAAAAAAEKEEEDEERK